MYKRQRILKLQFDSLKATIGQGLINVLSPVIKVINTIIGKLMTLANAFKAFTELLSGKKGSSGAASGMADVAAAAGKAENATSGVGDAAKKTAKELKGITTGIDELNIIDQSTDSSSGSGSGGGYSSDSFDMGSLADTTALDETCLLYTSTMTGLPSKVSLSVLSTFLAIFAPPYNVAAAVNVGFP